MCPVPEVQGERTSELRGESGRVCTTLEGPPEKQVPECPSVRAHGRRGPSRLEAWALPSVVLDIGYDLMCGAACS